jgi:hypothetical protein
VGKTQSPVSLDVILLRDGRSRKLVFSDYRSAASNFSPIHQFVGADVADRPQTETVFGPASDIEAMQDSAFSRHGGSSRRRCAETIDDVGAAAIDDGCDRLAST